MASAGERARRRSVPNKRADRRPRVDETVLAIAIASAQQPQDHLLQRALLVFASGLRHSRTYLNICLELRQSCTALCSSSGSATHRTVPVHNHAKPHFTHGWRRTVRDSSREVELLCESVSAFNRKSCRYDAIVIGVGGMGSAALYQLAKRGVKVWTGPKVES